ncbi:MAG: hypothetical protein K2Y37_16110 [Pirellulales bacterium]|nr:hypothetical protein [Pirellulales bacterium]
MFALACYDRLRALALGAAAAILLFGGLLKLADFEAGRPASGLLAAVPRAAVPLLAGAEIALAICVFVLGDRTPVVQYLTASAFLVLAAAAGWGLLIGAESCGCFGSLHVPPGITLLGDLGVALALFVLPPVGRPAAPIAPAARRAPASVLVRGFPLALALLVLALVHPRAALAVRALGLNFPPAGEQTRYLVPDEWLGTRFPLAREAGIAGQIAHGKWTVLFYHQGCPSCERARQALLGTSQRVVVIEVSPGDVEVSRGDIAGGAGPAIPDAWLFRALDRRQTWLVETPVIVELADGIVRAVRRA